MATATMEPVVIEIGRRELLETFDQLIQCGPEWAFTREHSLDFLDAVQSALCGLDPYQPASWRIRATPEFAMLLKGMGLGRLAA
ncbi:MAG: hypothetical protein JNM28_12995 [Armatimonadetes bacterium]|nr:hypothetical protein [Armatimonadota bacterium]MBX3110231.1 hypothetical protein [Fimbriimonadaceae bacterium]